MKKIIDKLNEQIEMCERRLKSHQRYNDEENINYLKPLIDGLLLARDLLQEDL